MKSNYIVLALALIVMILSAVTFAVTTAKLYHEIQSVKEVRK